jgi:acetylornithine deacetylase
VKLDPAETLRKLVAIPSVNPMGQDESGPDLGEARLTNHLASLFDSLGIEHHRDPVHPGRDNLIARIDGEVPCDRGGPLILLGAHQDTVPVGGMTIEPFSPRIKDGRLYGRGSCDVKGGMAAMLVAAARLADERPAGMPTVIVACTVNEEEGFSGARALARMCSGGGSVIPRLPDAAVIAEPTDLDVVVAHKGVTRWQCHTRGRAGHSCRPEAGENAIYKMAAVLEALQRYHREVLPGLGSHPLCGTATLSVGTIHGGVVVNTIPDRCTIEIDRRLRPGEVAAAAHRHLAEYLASLPGQTEPPTLDPPFMEGPAMSNADNGPLADRLASLVEEVAGRCRRLGVPYATDAAFLAAEGVPTVVFGPGSIAQAHTNDEWISLDQVERATEILYRFVSSWGLSRFSRSENGTVPFRRPKTA